MFAFSQLSFKTKLFIPLVFVSTVFTCVLAASYQTFERQIALNEELNEQLQPTFTDIEDAYRDLYQSLGSLEGLLARGVNPQTVEAQQFEFYDNAPKAVKRIQSFQSLIDTGIVDVSLQADLNRITLKTERWLSELEAIIKVPSNANALYEEKHPALSRDFSDIRKDIKVLEKAIEAATKRVSSEIVESTANAERLILGGTIVALILALLGGIILSRMLMKPVNEMLEALKNIASGDGDLTQRLSVQSQDEIGQLGDAFNHFVAKIQDSMKEVIEASNLLRSQTEQIESAIRNSVTETESQQRESDMIAAAVQEMSASSTQISQNAADAADATHTATQEVTAAQESLAATVNAMASLRSQIEQSQEMIGTLDNDVDSIASIVDVIRGIAEQTNLLALNAAIEAARAGEQGRGFAVVADEVRVLANKTQQSTEEIREMIERLESGTQNAVQAMNESGEASHETVNQIQQTSEYLDTVSGMILTINDQNSQVATASLQQRTVSEDVNRNVHGIVEYGKRVHDNLEQVEGICHELAQKSRQLDAVVGTFRV
ncbi:methyl-accepting chemotaxis protein [Enterovibrio paralichthyis]|uniref:methyl-accepting chemotaxis protein n=1 Tax=Enterovibrio paralichthyis TaxID=2853805 RepID=UPI001C48BF36|nr:methyl-accepting chemotaxis protein [Enterovibrio paralichthyis]MBV7297893.1 methyl-accepting chemotaxis protein [Enterovibrio paralichthyis]